MYWIHINSVFDCFFIFCSCNFMGDEFHKTPKIWASRNSTDLMVHIIFIYLPLYWPSSWLEVAPNHIDVFPFISRFVLYISPVLLDVVLKFWIQHEKWWNLLHWSTLLSTFLGLDNKLLPLSCSGIPWKTRSENSVISLSVSWLYRTHLSMSHTVSALAPRWFSIHPHTQSKITPSPPVKSQK